MFQHLSLTFVQCISYLYLYIFYSLSVALAVTLCIFVSLLSVTCISFCFNHSSCIQPQRECVYVCVCTYVCVCVCACCMRRLVPCPSRPLTSSLLASICTYSSLEPVASGPQVALRHTRHARRQRRSARRDGEVTVLGQHIALPITSKTCPGIPPYPHIPPSYGFLSFSLSFVVHNSRFEFVLLLYSPLLILIPFQEVAPSAAHQSVRHTLQLQGAPCRRT